MPRTAYPAGGRSAALGPAVLAPCPWNSKAGSHSSAELLKVEGDFMKSSPGKRSPALAALVLTITGAALLPIPFLGLLGLPLIMIGLVCCLQCAGSAAQKPPASRQVMGMAALFAGILLLGFGCLGTSVGVAWYCLSSRRGMTFAMTDEYWAALSLWIVAPILINQGILLRSNASGRRPLPQIAFWFIFFPLVALTVLLLAWLGVPLSA